MNLTSKQIAKKYNCDVFKDGKCFDNNGSFLVAMENEPLEDDEEQKFQYAEGWTLKELVEDIEENIKKRAELLAEQK